MQGMILTSTNNIAQFTGEMGMNEIPLPKVVTGWGYHWDDSARYTVVQMPEVIVRTVNGDGCAKPPSGQTMIFLDPNLVLKELDPWVKLRANVWLELGNEPNNYDASDTAAWTFRWWFIETLNACRARYPHAKIISPGLFGNRQREWWAICRDAFALADSIGFHAYAWHNFTSGDTGDIQRAIADLTTFFPNSSWMGTELGINDPNTSPSTKAERYSELHRSLPSQVLACCWYHHTNAPSDADQKAYNLPYSAWPKLDAGGDV
jgi:hypothetical protein